MRVEDLDPVVARVRNEQLVLRVEAEGADPHELSGFVASAAPPLGNLVVGRQLRDSLVLLRFGDVQASLGIDGDIADVSEFAGEGPTTALAAEDANQFSHRRVDQDLMVVRIGDVQIALPIERQSARPAQTVIGRLPGGEQLSIGGEGLNLRTKIDNVMMVFGIGRNGAGFLELAVHEALLSPDGLESSGLVPRPSASAEDDH
jgi:hypothetical protein